MESEEEFSSVRSDIEVLASVAPALPVETAG